MCTKNKKRKQKNYLLTFSGYYSRAGEDFITLRQPFSAKNDKEAVEIAKIHIQPYCGVGQPRPQNPKLVEVRTVAEGKELINNFNLGKIFHDAMIEQGFKYSPVGPAPLKKSKK